MFTADLGGNVPSFRLVRVQRHSDPLVVQHIPGFKTFCMVFVLLLAASSGYAADDPDACTSLTAQRKYHPGHYVAMNRFDAEKEIAAALVPGVVGVQIRYRWKELEPRQGVYDFSRVRADLKLLASHNAQLVVMIEDKTFNDGSPTPAYLQDYTSKNRVDGYTALRWSSFLVERMNALTAALGAEFDCDANFEGIALQETSLSLDDDVLHANGYTPELYRDALQNMLLSAAASIPHSRVFWYMNFLNGKQRYIADIAGIVGKAGVAMGGPDILPDSPALAARVYPFYQQFQGSMILFGSMQFHSYAHLRKDAGAKGAYWTLRELFIFARDQLHVSYIFWSRKDWRKPANSYTWSDAEPVIAAEPTFNR